MLPRSSPRRGGGPRSARAAEVTLPLLVDALPLLRSGLTPQAAEGLARLLLRRLDVDAVSVVDWERVLGRAGAGSDHHHVGDPHRTALTRRVLARPRVGVAATKRAIGCPFRSCPLTSAVVAPLVVQGRAVGALKLYRAGRAPVGREVVRAAGGLARIFGVYLELADLEAQAARAVETELEACRAQVNPHFLFNTLNAIAALTRTDASRAHDALVDFAELFRETLRSHGDVWTLGEEMEHVRRYVDIQRIRMGERLRVDVALGRVPAGVTLPVLAVQPLVENAIVHGLEPRPGGGRLTLRAARVDGCVEVVVEDDGVGIPPEQLAQVIEPGYGTGLGIGLANVDRRLRALYGPAFGVRLDSEVGRGTRAAVRVPLRRGP